MKLYTKYEGSRQCRVRQEDLFLFFFQYKSKAEGRTQKYIQSSNSTDPRHHMGKLQNIRKHHTQESQEFGPFPACDHMPM